MGDDNELRESIQQRLQSRMWELMRQGVEASDIALRLGKPEWYVWEVLAGFASNCGQPFRIRRTQVRAFFELACAMDCRMRVEFVPNEDFASKLHNTPDAP